MATGRAIQSTKQAGEFLVAAELCRQGYLATTFAGNVPYYDIVATGPDGRTRFVQVKAIRGATWQFNARDFVTVSLEGSRQRVGKIHPEPLFGLVCVLVRIDREASDEFFVLTWQQLASVIRQHYRAMLRRHNGVRPRKAESFHCAIRPAEVARFGRSNRPVFKSNGPDI